MFGKIEYGHQVPNLWCYPASNAARDEAAGSRGYPPSVIENSPIGIVSRMLQDPYKFFTGKKQKPKE